MSRPPVVDAHVHVLPDRPGDAPAVRDPYDIWEYGEMDSVEVLDAAGTIAEVAGAMQRAGCDHFVAANLFVVDNELARIGAVAGVGAAPSLATHREVLAERLRGFNTWALDLAGSRNDMTAFVAADPHVLPGPAGAEHLRWAHDRGAGGIKIHPVAQRFLPDDPAMDATYGVCEELGLGVIGHAGASRDGTEWAAPDAYAGVLRRHPRLRLVLAHMGGARWHQSVALAEAFPNVAFDLCEIIAWVGAPGAPTADELGRMIRQIGPERVLFGTDFPWYDVAATIDQVMALPHLGTGDKEAILGGNAIRIFGLTLRR